MLLIEVCILSVLLTELVTDKLKSYFLHGIGYIYIFQDRKFNMNFSLRNMGCSCDTNNLNSNLHQLYCSDIRRVAF